MKTLFLNIYGIGIKISTNSGYVFENLKKDFVLFLDKKEDYCSSAGITINTLKEAPPYWRVPALEASLYNLGSICYKQKDTHYVDYSGKGLMIYNFKEERADIYSEDEYLLYEKARLAILSRVGELMDRRHIHRLHALGLLKGGRATVCLLPMGAGKTTFALNVLKKDRSIRLLSDDICLIDIKNYIYPFMLRMGVRDISSLNGIPEKNITKIYRNFYGEKYLIDITYFKDRLAVKSKVYNILIGKRVFQEETEIKRISRMGCYVPFIQSGVFGYGLPQIVELFLRGSFLDILKKINLVFSRSLLFLSMIHRTNTYEIRIGRNLEASIGELIKFMNKN